MTPQTSGAVQLDLFGQVEAAETAAASATAWKARFERVEWVATVERHGKLMPFEYSRVLGYRCPDPDCGEVEPDARMLAIHHGFDPETPGRAPATGRCGQLCWEAEHEGRPAPTPLHGWAA